MKWHSSNHIDLVIGTEDKTRCLVKTKKGSICQMDYDNSKGIWYLGTEPYIYAEVDPVEYWEYLDDVDYYLTNGYDSSWCWEFGSTLADVAVPALTKWIEKAYPMYIYGVTPKEWQDILKKIRDSFAETKKILDGDYDSLPYEEKQTIVTNAEERRKEAFDLMAKYYLDMWGYPLL